ncbi:MAG: hypothetical protein E5W43_06655 [Mesorhizobium sp.]|nr:MAG: hypothetical protein E5W43_06655 [Mesorhizobium sp.]
MAVELACSNGEAQKADGVVDLIAAHCRAISELECLGKRLMDAEEAEAQLIRRRLDAILANETVIRRQAAMAPVANVGELKMSAATGVSRPCLLTDIVVTRRGRPPVDTEIAVWPNHREM